MASFDERQKKKYPRSEKPKKTSPQPIYYNNAHKNSTAPARTVRPEYTIPKYVIKHQSTVELEEFVESKDAKQYSAIPRNLVVEVQLPLLKSANNASLDVQEQHLSLKSEKPAKYHLELPLPYRVDPDSGNAKFDSKHKHLIVTLPVIRHTNFLSLDQKEDSGVESDHGSPVLEKSLEDEDEEEGFQRNGFSKNSLISVVEESENMYSEHSDIEDGFKEYPETNEAFMNPNIKYALPSYTCNIYENVLAVTIHAKNVDTESISYRILDNSAGFHILLTNVGAGFFPVYLSLCLKLGPESIDPSTLSIEPWDNNVVLSVSLMHHETLDKYLVGLDENLMESKDFTAAASIKNKLQALMVILEFYKLQRELAHISFY